MKAALQLYPHLNKKHSVSPVMYEDSWYVNVPEERAKKEEIPAQSSKHRRKESVLKQPNVRVEAFK